MGEEKRTVDEGEGNLMVCNEHRQNPLTNLMNARKTYHWDIKQLRFAFCNFRMEKYGRIAI